MRTIILYTQQNFVIVIIIGVYSKKMREIIRIPKVQIILLLLFLLLTAYPLIGFQLAVYLFISCLGYCVLSDLFFTYLLRRKLFIPYAAVVTSLIITLIVDPSIKWYQLFLICIIAMGIKNFVRIGGRHVFNPAASGFFVGWIILGINPSWWGLTLPVDNTLLQILLYIPLIGIAYVSALRLRRFGTILAYLLFYSIIELVNGTSTIGLLQTLINPGSLFYALVMLPEPQTSPVMKTRQILYGLMIAVLIISFVFLLNKLPISRPPDILISALLIGNILFFKFR
ncbi:MAG: hypothetical protein KatS3mg089_0851 [Patescibacteria group bacterium]|nr:MAG: hypothetical protein KatS3mg089_0851 [Patescibacteria group bacterium]